MELLGVVGHVEAHFCLFAYSVNLVQGRCTICAKYTTGMETFFCPTRWTS
jgi:hypothetical protein